MASLMNSIKYLRERKIPLLHKFFKNIEGMLPSLFYESITALISKPERNTMRKENYNFIYIKVCLKLHRSKITKMLTAWKKSYDQPREHIQKQRHYFANKGPSSQGYGFSSGHVWMQDLDYEES